MNAVSHATDGLYSVFGGDEDLGELVTLFVEEMPERVAQLAELLDQRDWEGVRRVAHQLKGAAGSYGFNTITDSAAEVGERLDGGKSEDEVVQAVNELVALCRRVKAGAPS